MGTNNKRIHYSWIILAVGTFVVFASLGLARFGYSIVLPSMQNGLNMDNTQAGGLATANLIGYLALSAIGGALAARFGPRIVISVGLLIACTGMILTGLSHSFFEASAWRALTGIGSGASNVPVMGLMAAWFGAKKRGLATGIAVAGSSIALIFIGPVVPYILSVVGDEGWRASWYLFGTATLIIAILSFLLLRNRPTEKGINPLGESENILTNNKQAEALKWGAVYRSGIVWHLGIVYIAFGFSYIIYMTFFVKHLIAEGGYSSEAAGGLFMIMGWFSLLCGLIWGGISDLIGRKWALAIVYLIQTLSYCLFALWVAPIGLTISAVLFGLTAWSIPAIMAATCGDILGARMAPAALGFITLFFGIGQALGPSIAGSLADASGSFFSSFLLAGGIAFLGAFGSFLLPASHKTIE